MKITNRKVEKKTSKVIIELLKFEDGNIFLLNTIKTNDKFVTTLYYCSFYDGFDFKYNSDGTDIYISDKYTDISKHHHTAMDKLFFAFEKVGNYNRILNALKD